MMTKEDFQEIAVFALMKNGDIHSVALNSTTKTAVMNLIAVLEGHIRIIDKPIEGIKHQNLKDDKQ